MRDEYQRVGRAWFVYGKSEKTSCVAIFPLPTIWLVAICAYWFATSPETIDNAKVFFSGAGVFTIILEYLLTKNKVFQVALVIAVPVLVASICSLLVLIVYSYAPEIILNSSFVFGFGLLILIRLLVIEKKNWSVKLVNVLSIPVFLFPVCAFVMYYPVITDTVIFEGHKYILADTVIRDYDNRPMQGFYRCEESTLNCELLVESSNGPGVRIVIDRKNHVVNLIREFNNDLVASFGKNSEISFRAESGRLGNHIYQMSQECNNLHSVNNYYSACDSYTYTLYECDLDFTGCHVLPMEYTSLNYIYDENFIWEANQNQRQINLYSDLYLSSNIPSKNFLVLTYGEHPQCYVDGCQILGK